MIVDPHPYHSDRPCDNKEKLNIKQKAENANQEGGSSIGLKQNTLLHRCNNALKSSFCFMALILFLKFKVLNLSFQENCNILKIWRPCFFKQISILRMVRNFTFSAT